MKHKKGYILPTQVSGHGLICVSMLIPDESRYRAALWGAMLELTEAINWQSIPSTDADETRSLEAAGYWSKLILENLKIGYCVDVEPPTQNIVEYSMDNYIFEYAPADPFTDPDEIPEGYLRPPFTVVTEGSLTEFVGYQVGDVLTDIYRFPTGSLPGIIPPGGFARIRMHITGRGRVQLYLINFILGGMAQVQRDGLISTITYVELQLDAASAPAETDQIIIFEIPLEDNIEHYIDVTFLPRVNDEIPFIYYGGGIRKVVFYGEVL